MGIASRRLSTLPNPAFRPGRRRVGRDVGGQGTADHEAGHGLDPLQCRGDVELVGAGSASRRRPGRSAATHALGLQQDDGAVARTVTGVWFLELQFLSKRRLPRFPPSRTTSSTGTSSGRTSSTSRPTNDQVPPSGSSRDAVDKVRRCCSTSSPGRPAGSTSAPPRRPRLSRYVASARASASTSGPPPRFSWTPGPRRSTHCSVSAQTGPRSSSWTSSPTWSGRAESSHR